MHGEASLAALKNTKFLYLCICYRQGLKNGAILTNFLIYRPFLPVFFTLYQRDKHLKKAMVPVPFSIPVSCTINRLLPMLSCSNMQRLSQQVCCIYIELVLCPWGSLCVRQLHLTEGFIMLPAPLEVKSAHMIAHFFNSSCKGQEFKQKFQHAVKLLFCTFIALLIILQSFPLFAYCKLAGFWLVSVFANKNDGKSTALQKWHSILLLPQLLSCSCGDFPSPTRAPWEKEHQP